MSNVEQFEKVVTEAGAVAMRIMRGRGERSGWSFRRPAV